MKKILLALSFVLTANLFAYTQCERIPNRVYLNLTEGQDVWICFEEGAGCVYKTTLTEKDSDKLYSLALTAIVGHKKLNIRYMQDDVACEVLTATHNNHFNGLWLVK